MSTSWLFFSIFQSGSNLLRYWTNHHIAPARFSYNKFWVGLGLVLNASRIKDHNSEEEFQNLFDHVFIDHRRTSRDHPQANDGLVKRMVQTCKKGLRKICFIKNKENWDLALPYIAMGYRMSKHASLSHFSPYFLLFGRHPIPPSSIVVQMDQVVDLNSPATWARVIAERVALFRRVMPMAMENLSIT